MNSRLQGLSERYDVKGKFSLVVEFEWKSQPDHQKFQGTKFQIQR
tara:strand:+ start:70 stop:204 length:135 start_codon:yes stop_codon:yes gene_type:complete